MQRRVDALGVWGALPLGVLFALAFCPISAACFFVSLLALASAHDSRIVLPSLYGLGTALPVVAFAALIAVSARAVGRTFNLMTQIAWWVQRATGLICLAIGIHLSLKYVFELPLFYDPWLDRLFALICASRSRLPGGTLRVARFRRLPPGRRDLLAGPLTERPPGTILRCFYRPASGKTAWLIPPVPPIPLPGWATGCGGRSK